MPFKFLFACAAALTLLTTGAEASATYLFHINTGSLSGTSGFLEFQLGNSGITPFQEATATITNFQAGGGTLANIDPYSSTDLFGTPDVLGTVFGTLPATLVLDDNGASPVADYLHPFTFGNSISFLLTLGGPAVDAPECPGPAGACALHSFGVGILDAGENYQFVADPLGGAFLVGGLDVSGNGTVTPYFNPAPGGAASALSITTPVPEPAAWSLMLAGLAVLALAFRRRAPRLFRNRERQTVSGFPL